MERAKVRICFTTIKKLTLHANLNFFVLDSWKFISQQ